MSATLRFMNLRIPISFVLFIVPAITCAQLLEEIVVTAQKREQSVDDIGITINAFSKDYMRENRVLTSQDIAAHTPNLHVVNQFSTAFPTYHLRGVGLNDFNSNNTSAVGIYQDGVFQTAPPMHGFQILDLERVEVLKGPQGTLYGKNTTGGAINFISARPTQEPEGYINVDFGRFEEGRVQAAYGRGITETLAGRVAVAYDFGSGYIHNRVTGNDIHAKDKFSGRALLEWTPAENATILFNLHGGVDRSDAGVYQHQGLLDINGSLDPNDPSAFCAPAVNGTWDYRTSGASCVDIAGYSDTDGDLHDGDFDLEPTARHEAIGGSITVDWDITDQYHLKSITGFESYDRLDDEDVDSSPNFLSHLGWRDDIFQISQELQLSSETEALHWTAGLYYAWDQITSLYSEACPQIQFGPCTFTQDYRQTTTSTAVFGHVEYRFAETWNFTVAGRYSYEVKDFNSEFSAALSIPDLAAGNLVANFSEPIDENTYNSFSWKVGLDKDIGEDALVYASISKGFKTGGFQGGFTFGGPTQLLPFEDESLLSYEAGFKSKWLDNTLQLNAAAFFYDYEDVQLYSSIVDPTLLNPLPIQVLNNGSDAEITGIEADMQWYPIEALKLTFDIGWLDHKLKNFRAIPGQPATAEGNALANTPDINLTVSGTYTWGTQWGDLSAMLEYYHQSSLFFDTFNAPLLAEDSIFKLNARVGLKSQDGRYEVALWAQNLTDEEYLVFGFPFGGFGLNFVYPGEPRRYGVSLSYNFD